MTAARPPSTLAARGGILLSILVSLAAFSCLHPQEARAQDSAFSGERAYAIVKILAGSIGPRPMGSPAERRGLEFAVSKFREYGCQQSYVMPFRTADGVNTSSGIAVGVVRGKTGRMIVIGGHMDTAGPDVPGANDDASGCAVVMEAARVLARRKPQSTLLFCCWGGEEEGMCGSRFFVDHFQGMDSVVLMIQVDMADGGSSLGVDPDGPFQVSAPRWLVRAAFEVFSPTVGRPGLNYATQSQTLNSSLGGMTGSDHATFLERGIPAIDFTSSIDYPIHTPLDDLDHFDPSGLSDAGNLVIGLANRFDGGVPPRGTEQYWLQQAGSILLFFPHALLWMLVCGSAALSLVALAVVRKRRVVDAHAKPVRHSALKVLLFTFIVQVFLWTSPNIVGVIKGERFPWVHNVAGFAVLGVIMGVLGLWFALRWARRLRLSRDPSVYLIWSTVLFLGWTALFALASVELALYPAWAILFVSLAMLARKPWLRALFLMLAPYLLLRLVFFEDIALLQREMTTAVLDTFAKVQLYQSFFVIVFTFLMLPFSMAFAALYRDGDVDYFWLRQLARPNGGLAVGGAAAAVAIVLMMRPTYDRFWESSARVEERFSAGSETMRLSITGGEYLNGIKAAYGPVDTVLSGRLNSDTAMLSSQAVPCSILARTELADTAGLPDSLHLARRVLEIRSRLRPLRVNIRYRSPDTLVCSSPWVARTGRMFDRLATNVKTFSWYAFPDSVLVVPVTFLLRGRQRVAESVEVTMDRLALPVRLERDLTFFTKRTVVTREDTFGAPRVPEDVAAVQAPAGKQRGNKTTTVHGKR